MFTRTQPGDQVREAPARARAPNLPSTRTAVRRPNPYSEEFDLLGEADEVAEAVFVDEYAPSPAAAYRLPREVREVAFRDLARRHDLRKSWEARIARYQANPRNLLAIAHEATREYLEQCASRAPTYSSVLVGSIWLLTGRITLDVRNAL